MAVPTAYHQELHVAGKASRLLVAAEYNDDCPFRLLIGRRILLHRCHQRSNRGNFPDYRAGDDAMRHEPACRGCDQHARTDLPQPWRHGAFHQGASHSSEKVARVNGPNAGRLNLGGLPASRRAVKEYAHCRCGGDARRPLVLSCQT